MRFLLYNIRYGAGVGARFHLPVPYAGYFKRSTDNLDNIVAFIKSINPDIIGLVEVDGGSFRTGNLCQAEVIADQLGHNHVVQSKYDERSVARKFPILKDQGNALISNQEILEYHFHYFKEGVKRLVIEAHLEEVTIFLVHLSLTYRKRHYQLENLYQLTRAVQGPVIVAGDFNVLWGGRELELFLGATHLVSANSKGQPSHPSRAPKRQLDFILHTPDLHATNFYLPAVKLSDHVPLVCDFELKDA